MSSAPQDKTRQTPPHDAADGERSRPVAVHVLPKPPADRLPPTAGKLAGRSIAELAGGVVHGARGPGEPTPAPPAAGLPALPRPDDAAMANLDLDVDLDLETTVEAPAIRDRSLLKPATPPNHLPAICAYGRYEILGRIAFGGMAEIFLGRENLSAGATRMLVIKRILPQVADDRAFVEMFLDEARLAIQLSHSHICHIYEFGEIEGTYFIAMEWIHGATLGKVIRRAREKHGLAPELVVKILAQVAEALDYAHQARDQAGNPLHIVHRDVTPHNIMVSYGGQVKLLDFGIAKAESASTKTEAGVVKGKFAYMSPQQCLGRDIDARADVFALGICLYEALTGRSLYQRSTDYETMKAVIEEPVPSIRDVRPELPMELDAIVQRALQKNVDDRWPSAGQLQGALEDWLASIGRAVPASRVADLMTSLFEEEVQRGPLLDSTPFGQSFKRLRSDTEAGAVTRALTPSQPLERGLDARMTDPDAVVPASLPPPAAPPTPSWSARVGLGLAALASLAIVGGGAWYLGRATSAEPRTAPVATTAPPPSSAAPPATSTTAEPPSTSLPPSTTTIPAIAQGRLVVHVDARGATVRVDDHELSATELVDGLSLAAGPHTVHAEHAERRAFEATVEIASGETETLEAHLEPRVIAAVRPPGMLSIDTRPWSKVYVGPRLLGTTPIAEAEVQSGSVRLRIVDRDGRTFTRTITVPPNQESRVFYNLDE
ncbi:MAG: serine/threonine-protein kinase [Sandaracinus sp.]